MRECACLFAHALTLRAGHTLIGYEYIYYESLNIVAVCWWNNISDMMTFSVLIFWSSMIHIMVSGTPTLDFFLPSNEPPNVIRFECINSNGVPDPTARFEFYNSTRDLITRQDTDINQVYLTYTITEDSIIRCIVGEQHSEDFMFAGKLIIAIALLLAKEIIFNGIMHSNIVVASKICNLHHMQILTSYSS